MWASLVVAGLALFFTIGSFWWLYARRGPLQISEPHTFAAYVSDNDVRIRLPLVMYNTGAVPIVVQNLRMVFPEDNAPLDYPWRNTRTQLTPASGDNDDLPAVFAVPGRQVVQKFIEFGGPFPGFVPVGRDVTAGIEAKLGHRDTWQHLLTFTLHMQHVAQKGIYLAHSNSRTPCTPDEAERANEVAKELLEKMRARHPGFGQADSVDASD
ncbi:hypothetical protein [Jiangella sp. DSM 45060]|uniref:hypothetical protein n=1 Tax=Jiangella sp. DSM 45060 TaxID=1798224 RepID=UPI00087BD899|nr:hypothetical protein [Jiangella sp. DSM 45060]SDT37127.1 hypothetical protein SAMN04515669_3757 [Jiangella sp. DSM 45060]